VESGSSFASFACFGPEADEAAVAAGARFVAGDFFVGDFLAGGLVVAGVLAEDVVVGVFFAGDFVAGVFFAGDFVAGVRVAGVVVVGDVVAGAFVAAGLVGAVVPDSPVVWGCVGAPGRDAAAARRVDAGSGSNVRVLGPDVGGVGESACGAADRDRARAEPGIGRRGSSRSWITGATILMTSSSLADASGSRRTPYRMVATPMR
jgi:hypothetical protein